MREIHELKENDIMNVMLFLGAGISIPSGMPTTQGITSSILRGEWHSQPDSLYYSGPQINALMANWVPNIKNYLTILDIELQIYLNNRYHLRSHTPTYEDYFYHILKLQEEQSGFVDDVAVNAFSYSIRKQVKKHLNPMNSCPFEELLIETQARSLDYIKCVVWHLLSKNVEPIGFDLLGNTLNLKEVEHLDIVTLNHDTLIETILRREGIVIEDGFGSQDGDVRWFNGVQFSNLSKIHLLKLHGSIDWFGYIHPVSGIYHSAQYVGIDCHHAKNSQQRIIENRSFTPLLITGTDNKIRNYSRGIFLEVHRCFQICLRNCDLIIVSGYSWSDRDLNVQLFEWLSDKQNRRILLFNEHAIDQVKYILNVPGYWHKIDALLKEERIIHIPRWLCNASTEHIIPYLTS